MKKYRRGEIIDTSSLMRMLAKNGYARLLWVIAGKTNNSMFDGYVSEWSPARIMFCNWCMFYDSVYQAYKRPPDYIIKDNEKIDEWLKFQTDQQEMDAESDYRNTGKGTTGRSAYDHDEVFVQGLDD